MRGALGELNVHEQTRAHRSQTLGGCESEELESRPGTAERTSSPGQDGGARLRLARDRATEAQACKSLQTVKQAQLICFLLTRHILGRGKCRQMADWQQCVCACVSPRFGLPAGIPLRSL